MFLFGNLNKSGIAQLASYETKCSWGEHKRSYKCIKYVKHTTFGEITQHIIAICSIIWSSFPISDKCVKCSDPKKHA